MREIKFRAWFKEEKRMVDWSELSDEWTSYFVTLLDARSGRNKGDATDDTLMQYTGLNDKNGKEIYEGDIVRGREGTVLGEVRYGQYVKGRSHKHDSETNHSGWFVLLKNGGVKSLEDLEWHIKLTNYAPFRGNYLELIGNIYENPELLTSPASQ
jgi:uncharacterized phage protein (TIGR01671 family)